MLLRVFQRGRVKERVSRAVETMERTIWSHWAKETQFTASRLTRLSSFCGEAAHANRMAASLI
jgi:hypothetical protein